MSNEMIERVARQAYIGWCSMMAEKGKVVLAKFEDLNESELKWAYEYARIAIEAMREPTEAMINVGLKATPVLYAAIPSEVWKAMIDAALKDD